MVLEIEHNLLNLSLFKPTQKVIAVVNIDYYKTDI